MGTVIIDRRGTKLEYQSGALLIREPDARPKSIPLARVERLVINGSVSLDSNLLTQLASLGGSVLLLPGRGAQRGSHLHSAGHGDALRRLGQYRLSLNEPRRLHWARRLVAMRLTGAERLLRTALTIRPERRLALVRGGKHLARLRGRACHAERLASLRGLEGGATAAFYRAYGELFAATLAFNGRNRRPPRDPVNAALSLGYTLVHSDALRAIAQAGLDPMLGVLHDWSHNRDSLACDLTEVARPRVERLVWRLFAERQLRAESFSREGEGIRMNKAAQATFYAAYEAQATVHRRWLRRLCAALVGECLNLQRGASDI